MTLLLKKCQQDERKGVQALLQRWKKKQEELMAEKRRFEKMMVYEKEAQKQGFQYVAGIDEVGRGPLAGPVVAAAVILPENIFISGINDSKNYQAKNVNSYIKRLKTRR